MPVARGPRINTRSALLVGFTSVVIAVLLVVAVIWLANSSSKVEVNLGDSDFRDLDAQRISAEIAERGPILFSDVAGGDRDIILQHLGSDPGAGWIAFDARRAGDRRDCFFRWQPESSTFANTCDESDVVDASGTGLTQYPVIVEAGEVRVDSNADR
jgi:hypothetical protein